ncbi:4'-phosphopantetheinyl transferase superfamily protein [Lysinibacillus sphaericus]|uniref:Phosphopantetheinyl transferase n=4 Tax=Lysinibacillus TaxID=400634 RepID=W7RV24_LYSSH|nr:MULTISPECIES: 4'-phosphopantetheinyl transferase superfamily protein [Lysinibacillus]ACA37773.1 putative phosphopantetheinyl transferase [Lysinibacillus sphaericus C3-41]MBE5086270.1 4'-phosphopantetheinyl transferase superfamily protein [Bacillus thuringiensis]AMO31978.1 phosphopantetheinyl transferase [Lysinibacillus sphaericus]AMR88903.1 phosphopantetheinyl transferase [Lysinibacillus sphaericus]ANA46974.1 phosphopantetheinyl transferase [Lysinibacillus sphaericus]
MSTNDIQLFALPLGEPLTSAEWNVFHNVLPSHVQRNIQQYKQWQDRQRALLGNTLIRWVLLPFMDKTTFQITQDIYGRPNVASHQHWKGDFNLSHSGDWIVLALTTNGRVGIDVEEIKPVNKDIMHFALSKQEFHMALHQPLHVFYELWTLKEALFKTGLFPHLSPHMLDTIDIKKTRADLSTQLHYLDQRHPVTICWNNGSTHVKITTLNKHQLLQS